MPTGSSDSLRDPRRLAELESYGVLDTPPTADFDRLTRLAARLLHAPVALVSLVTGSRQFFKSCPGLPEPWATRRETPLSHSFCQHVVNTAEPLIIEDAREHPLVRENLAVSEIGVVAYLGIPLVTQDGHVLGSFCVIDTNPRAWTPEEIETLAELAASVMTQLNLDYEVKVQARLREEMTIQRDGLNVMLASIGDAVLAADSQGLVTFQNPAAEELTGWPTAEAVGMPVEQVFRIVDESTRTPVEQPVRKVLASGVIQGPANQTILISKDGTERPIDDRAAPIKASDGRMVGAILVFRGIAERLDAERKLKDAQSQLDSALEAGAIATWAWDIPNDRIVADRTLARLFSVSPEDAAGGPLSSYLKAIHPDDRQRTAEIIEQAIRSGEPYEAEYRIVQSDGSTRWVVARGKAENDGEGNPQSLSGVLVDISERKRREQESESLAEQLRLVLDSAELGSWHVDPATMAMSTNERFRTIFGTDSETLAYEEAVALIHPDDRDKVRAAVEAAVRPEDPQPYAVEYRVVHPDGLPRWVFAKGRANLGSTGDGTPLLSFDGTVLDITERKRAEEALKASEVRFRAFVTASSDAVYRMSPDWSEMHQLIGRQFIPDTDGPSRDWLERYIVAEDRPQVLEAIAEAVRTGGSFELEHRVRRVDGSLGWTFSRAVPVLDEGGDVIEWFGTASDITERKRTEMVLKEQKHILELVATGAALSRVLDALCLMVEGHAESTLFASVLVLDRDGRHLKHGGAPSLPEAYNRIVDGIATGPTVGSCGSAVFRREPVFVADIATDPLWADYVEIALSFGLRACWSIPIFSTTGEVLGTFAMYHPNPRTPNPEDLHLVDIVTRTAAIAIERDRAEEDRKRVVAATARRNEQLQKLADLASRVTSARDVNSVIGVVTEEARNLVGAHQSATSMVLNPDYPQPLNVVSNSDKYPHGLVPPGMDSLAFYDVVREANEPIRLTRSELDADDRWNRLAKVASIDPTANGWLAAPLIGRDGRSMGLIQLADKQGGDFDEDDEAILSQLSQLASIAIQNARLNEELRSNDERKDEFLAMLAHELRNPLAAIGHAVSLGKKTGEKSHIDWAMEVISRQMQHLSRLIDDLMDVSRITRGKIQLRRDAFDLTPILESAASTVGPLVEERKHTLKLDIEPGGLWVNVDPTRIEQVVVNLLNNAAKYSENEGHVLLSARKDKGRVVVSIKDKGVGIAPEKLPEMFELFAQGDRSLARSEGGLGIGLTVVKKLVEMHGGTITATSEGVGKGSEFIVILPLVAKPAETQADAAPTLPKASRKASILVVDDNVDTARGMARLLKMLGHEVRTAHNGFDAIEVAKESNPEFILLDIGLPGMSGYEVAAQLRQEECCNAAVIIAISGYGQSEDRRRSKESGFDHHLTKPLDTDVLLSLISTSAG